MTTFQIPTEADDDPQRGPNTWRSPARNGIQEHLSLYQFVVSGSNSCTYVAAEAIDPLER